MRFEAMLIQHLPFSSASITSCSDAEIEKHTLVRSPNVQKKIKQRNSLLDMWLTHDALHRG